MSGSDGPVGDLDRQWYVLEGREIRGPFSGHAIVDMVRERTIAPEARVAPVGANEWQPLGVLTDKVMIPEMPDRPPAVPVVDEQRRYAGFWIRVGAYLLDYIFFIVIFFVVFFALGVALALATRSPDALNEWISGHQLLLNVVGSATWYLAETLFVGGRWQATPGKRICGIYVIRASGARVGYGRAFARVLCYILDGVTLGIGFMMAGWTQEKTALHDLICDTRVVYGRPQPYAAKVAASF